MCARSAECRTDCPPVKMVVFGGYGGALVAVNNTAHGGYGGFTLRAPCSSYAASNGGGWGGNVAQGNAVGFDVESGCGSLFLEGYRNAAGVTANVAKLRCQKKEKKIKESIGVALLGAKGK